MKLKLLKSVLLSLLFSIFSGSVLAGFLGVEAVYVQIVLFVASFIPGAQTGMLAGVYREVWTGEMIKAFNLTGTFLDRVPDYSRFVGNSVIHLTKIGAQPDVLINNTVYPLTPKILADEDVPIPLDTLETEATTITDDELYAISYNKMQVAIELHRDALVESVLKRAIYSFAPDADSPTTPIIKTSGEDNGDSHKRMTIADIITLKRKFDEQKIPADNRVLVLCPQHVNDLLLVSEAFQRQYQNIETGKVLNLYGFKIHEFPATPVYNTSFGRKEFKAEREETDREASVAFFAKRMFKAKGELEVYLSEAKNDPLNKRNILSFIQKFIAVPKTKAAIGAIVSSSI